jgi:hypothetical protein
LLDIVQTLRRNQLFSLFEQFFTQQVNGINQVANLSGRFPNDKRDQASNARFFDLSWTSIQPFGKLLEHGDSLVSFHPDEFRRI